jgi:hypothetical protein
VIYRERIVHKPTATVALALGMALTSVAATAAITGYEVTYDMVDLRISHDGSFGPAKDSSYCGSVGQAVPDAIGLGS